MRINLDEPEAGQKPEQADTDDTEGDETAPDGFVIRRDLLAERRRRRPPRTLSPLEQKLIAVGLMVVITVAGVSLFLYVRTVQSNAGRIPRSAIAPPSPTRAMPRAGAPTGAGAYRFAPPSQAAPPGGGDGDDRTPTEGIH
jgi:hypothetical protein